LISSPGDLYSQATENPAHVLRRGKKEEGVAKGGKRGNLKIMTNIW
jgi:hypothetical protein